MSSGVLIRNEIAGILKLKRYSASIKNIEFIFSKHMADSTDMRLSTLIDMYSWELKRD